ncbi:MAG: immune inhibitor A [Taibaiella sp.]|nr:immune inhibitor A [Taibaiella sp.]
MRILCIMMAMFFCLNTSFAQKKERYSRAKIYLDNKEHTIRKLSELGVAVDHGEAKKGTFFISDYSVHEIRAIKKAGFKVDIIIKDVTKYYREQNKKNKHSGKLTASTDCNPGPALDAPAHFALGSYAGYFTYTELLTILDSMHTLYPGLISSKAAIDTFHSIEGRPIYWVRVSDNPTVDQPAKPQILYTALHHAREPGSISSTIYYLWYLLEHYATDPHIKSIIDNTELYFVPCVNPDGYLYNIATNPGGGGLWRKNRRVNTGGTMGVDLNRNYGFQFAFDNIGSSPMTSSDTYRGTAGFSEPETQAIKWLSDQHRFKICLNYHTYGNDLIYPWGYIGSLLTPDSLQFQGIGAYLTKYTPYRYGTGDQTVGYVTNGVSDDWMYGDTTAHPKIFAMTPETGLASEGFYAPATSIIPNSKNNLVTNINAANLLLPYATLQHTDQKIITQPTGHLHYSLQRLGYPDTATYTVTITPLDSWMTVSSATNTYSMLAMLQKVNDSVAYTIAAATPNGQLIKYELKQYNGYYYTRDTVEFYYGKTNRNVIPNPNTLTDWSATGWANCNTNYYTAPASIGSSLTGCNNYTDNANITIQLTQPVDLRLAIQSFMYFYCNWGIESTYDYVAVYAAPEGTGAWQPLCGRFTKPGTTSQLNSEPIYDGQHQEWVQEELDLHDFIGQKIDIQFELVSDGAVNYSGFYFDDLNVISVIDSTMLSVAPLSSAAATLKVYPNPACETLNIEINGQQQLPTAAALYDYMGRVVKTINITQSKTTIDISALPPNFYYLKTGTFPVEKVCVVR